MPSLTHNSAPAVPSPAVKKSLPRAAAQTSGTKPPDWSVLEPEPGKMSLACQVLMPSLTQSSRPEEPSSAEKKTRLPTRVSPSGLEEAVPGAMSATWTVPGAVPSVRQSSNPFGPSPV